MKTPILVYDEASLWRLSRQLDQLKFTIAKCQSGEDTTVYSLYRETRTKKVFVQSIAVPSVKVALVSAVHAELVRRVSKRIES